MGLSDIDIIIYNCVCSKHAPDSRIVTLKESDTGSAYPYRHYWAHEMAIEELGLTELEVRQACNRLDRAGLFHRRHDKNKDVFYVSTPVQIATRKGANETQ